MKLQNPNMPITVVIFSFVLWFGLYFGLYFAGWPGHAHPCVEPPYCFCETVYPGTLAAQKSNTWSDLGFVLAAIFIAIHGSRHLKSQPGKERADIRYNNNTWLISLYAAAIFYMGPGSMFFHGSMTTWGGMMDVISMYVFVLYVIAYLVYRVWALSIKSFYLIYALSCLVFALIAIFTHDLSSQIFPLVAGSLITLALIQSIPQLREKIAANKSLRFNYLWLMYAIGFFVTAVIIWRLSDSGQAYCYPDSLIQGHAIWHLLSACMTVCIHFYFLSEKSSQIES